MADLQQFCINGDCSELMDADDYYTKTETYNKTEVYNKTQTYTKAEVDALISGGGGSGLIYVQDVSPTGGVKTNDVTTNVASGNYAFASGAGNSASGTASHVEGENNTASGDGSHAEGWATAASNDAAHAEGTSTTASGIYSHAEGESNIASGKGSHVEGFNNDARGEYQHVGGKFAEYDDNNTYAMMIGNGTSSSNRKNAFAVDWNGNATFDGRVDADNVGIHYITSGTHNLNNYKSEGMWYFSTGATLSNQPNSAANGWLQVLSDRAGNGVSVKQIWYRHGSNPTTFKEEYVRLFASGSWGSWVKMATESDVTGAFDSTQTVESTRIIRTTKLPDGTMICSFRLNVTTAITTAWGSIFYSSMLSLGNWPTAFAATPAVTVSLEGASDAWVGAVRNVSTTSAGNTYLYRATSQASNPFTLSVIAIGRWQ